MWWVSSCNIGGNDLPLININGANTFKNGSMFYVWGICDIYWDIFLAQHLWHHSSPSSIIQAVRCIFLLPLHFKRPLFLIWISKFSFNNQKFFFSSPKSEVLLAQISIENDTTRDKVGFWKKVNVKHFKRCYKFNTLVVVTLKVDIVQKNAATIIICIILFVNEQKWFSSPPPFNCFEVWDEFHCNFLCMALVSLVKWHVKNRVNTQHKFSSFSSHYLQLMKGQANKKNIFDETINIHVGL